MKRYKIAIVGSGKMGTMIAERLIAVEFCSAESVGMSKVGLEKQEKLQERFPNSTLHDNNPSAIQGADIIFLSLRPESFPAVAEEITSQIKPEALIISVMTGISNGIMQERIGCNNLIRTSTNIGIRQGAATTFWTPAANTNEQSIQLAKQIFDHWGDEIKCREERWLDIAIAGVGSGPALVMEFLVALTRAMVTEGMPHDLAQRGVFSLVKGTTALCSTMNGGAIEDLQRMVTTPGGITAEALLAFDEGRFNATVINGFRAACRKVKQLG